MLLLDPRVPVIQFTSHVAPPSKEDDCAHVAERGATSFQLKRTRSGTQSIRFRDRRDAPRSTRRVQLPR